jgi:hypothetical protein
VYHSLQAQKLSDNAVHEIVQVYSLPIVMQSKCIVHTNFPDELVPLLWLGKYLHKIEYP